MPSPTKTTFTFNRKPPTPAPVSSTPITLTPPPKPKTRKRGRPARITPEQVATARRCRNNGLSKEQTAAATNLTPNQVHYLWYIKDTQKAKAKATREANRPAPLAHTVPSPITKDHTKTMPDHTYKGTRTRLRTDFIEQVGLCRSKGHPARAVAEHFNCKESTIRYIWYQLNSLTGNSKHPDEPEK